MLLRFLVVLFGIATFSAASSAASTRADTTAFPAIGLPAVKTGTPARPVVVAIVDDGVRTSHVAVRDFLWINPGEIRGNGIDDDGNGYVDDVFGWDVADGDASVDPPTDDPDFYHGTHVASLVTGIARQAFGADARRAVRIMPVKALSDRADSNYLKAAFSGIEYAIAAGADVILCAWGVNSMTPAQSRLLARAAALGIVVVASSGNLDEERDQYPAAHESVIAVGGVDRNGVKVVHSNYGQFIDLMAPAEKLRGADVASDTSWTERDGTSSAAALVAGGAALVRARYPDFAPRQVRACLLDGARPSVLTDTRYSAKLGAGLLDIEGALRCPVLTEKRVGGGEYAAFKGHLAPGANGEQAWTISPPGAFKGLRFSLVSGTSTGRLVFRQREGQKPIAAYVINELPPSVFVEGSTTHVTWEPPQGPRHDDNWLLAWEAEAINFTRLYCRDTVVLDKPGSIGDGSGDAPYAYNTDCKWQITAPPGKKVSLRFNEFDTEPNRDLVYLFDGSGTHEQIMAIFSGTRPPPLVSWREQVLIWFVSDGEDQRAGWQLDFDFVDP